MPFRFGGSDVMWSKTHSAMSEDRGFAYNFCLVGTLKPPFYKMFVAKEKIQYTNVIVFERTELRQETWAFCIIIVLRFIVISNIISKINDSVNFDY